MIDVVIIEDDPMVSMITEKIINSVGEFRVVKTFKEGKKAIKYLEQNHVELIILDMFLPDTNGLVTLETIRKKKIGVEVIFLTASNNTVEIERAFKLGAIDYLIKPFDFNRLKDSLGRYLNKKSNILGKEVLSQGEVDKLFLRNKTKGSSVKGISEKTLKKIMDVLLLDPSKEWSSKEISDILNTSTVTVKKYLDHLMELGRVENSIYYGSVGRPEYKYKVIL
ncbi:response regulator [Fusobacteria bacterium ZRK30]|nr:response regulator [Fusobacteria bacterium ZRK30]